MNFDDVQRVYLSTVRGRELPTVVHTTGTVLNQYEGRDIWDPDAWYQVTTDGITRLPSEPPSLHHE